uniref:Chaoptin n=1 Tax=Timema cristinae TaxID=61476 RepID=A0A7R9CXZ4_TIMCR|nr:unnamed protein product [Timema cristinae]
MLALSSLMAVAARLLKRNQISKIDDDAFSNLTSLRELELNDNRLSTLPKAIGTLTSLQELSLSGNRLKNIPGVQPHTTWDQTYTNLSIRLDRGPLKIHSSSTLPLALHVPDVIGT